MYAWRVKEMIIVGEAILSPYAQTLAGHTHARQHPQNTAMAHSNGGDAKWTVLITLGDLGPY
jgi:hypothetical protein